MRAMVCVTFLLLATSAVSAKRKSVPEFGDAWIWHYQAET